MGRIKPQNEKLPVPIPTTSMTYYSVAHLTCHVIIEVFKRCGIQIACIAPGSRSTPLVKALSEQTDIQLITHYDERSLGFFALGTAKKTRIPAIVITTSGSAVSNLLPSCTEAFYAQVPILYLSADRPPDLHDCGANQSINQAPLLSPMTKQTIQLPVPKQHHDLAKLASTIQAAVLASQRGPVHINCPFEEPFFNAEPVKKSFPNLSLTPHKKQDPITDTLPPKPSSNTGKKCLLILASTAAPLNQAEILEWARTHQVPLIAECTSSLGLHPDIGRGMKTLLNHIDPPDRVICIGSKWISKRLQHLIQSTPEVLLYHDYDENQDFLRCATAQYQLHPNDMPDTLPPDKADQHYYKTTSAHINSHARKPPDPIKDTQALTEAHCIQAIAEASDQIAQLFIGNSLSIRLVNDLFQSQSSTCQFMTQRGASGIDGLISTAAGYALNTAGQTIALIGDTSFLHDVNGLHCLKDVPMTIVCINNNGGALFRHLPIKEDPICETFFVMPHGRSLKGLCDTFDCEYKQVNTMKDLRNALKTPTKTARVIDAVCEREIRK